MDDMNCSEECSCENVPERDIVQTLCCPRCYGSLRTNPSVAFDTIVVEGRLLICDRCKTELNAKYNGLETDVDIYDYLATYGRLKETGL